MSSGIQKFFQLICAFKRILSPQNRKVHPAPEQATVRVQYLLLSKYRRFAVFYHSFCFSGHKNRPF